MTYSITRLSVGEIKQDTQREITFKFYETKKADFISFLSEFVQNLREFCF